MNEDALVRFYELAKLGISKRRAGLILFNEGLCDTPEKGRDFVRRHAGEYGNKSTKKVDWDVGLPVAIESGFNIIELPKATDSILCLFDIHLPFHSVETIEEALSRKKEYDTIILNEVFDFYDLSRFSKEKKYNIAVEQEMFFRFMEWMRKQVPKHQIYFQLGNHDERYWKFMMGRARELSDLQGMEFETIFGFNDFNIRPIPMRNLLKFRELHIGHGHEIGIRAGGVNPARSFYLKAKGNYIGGHLHRTSEHIEKNIKGEVSGCWSVGAACLLDPLYLPINNWNNGYAIIRKKGSKNFDVENVKVL